MRKTSLKTLATAGALLLCLAAFAWSSPTPEQKTTVNWKLSLSDNPGGKYWEAVKLHLADEITKRTDGAITFTMYPETQLGSLPEIIQNMQAGVVETMFISFSNLAGHVPECQFLGMPFIFDSAAHADRFFKTPEARELYRAAESKNFYIMGMGLIGFRYPASNSRLLKTPEDMKGFKMRVIENPVTIEVMKTLGALPVVIAYGEVYEAIRTKVVDGYENDSNSFNFLSIYEVAPYLTELPLYTSGISYCISKKVLDSLAAEQQKIIREVCDENVPKVIAATRQNNTDLLEVQKKEKFREVYVVTDTKAFRDVLQPFYSSYLAKTPVLQKYVDAVNRAR